MTNRLRVSKRRDRQIAKALRSGKSFRQVGAAIGISHEKVRQIAQRLGIPSGYVLRQQTARRQAELKAERMRQLPCFLCGGPSDLDYRRHRAYCDDCHALLKNDVNIYAALSVRVASILIAQRTPKQCIVCGNKMKRRIDIMCSRHGPELSVRLHSGRRAIREHPEINWQSTLRRAARCSAGCPKPAAPGQAYCLRCITGG